MNTMKYIHTDNAPKAVGPYSQAIAVNGFIYCAGQIGLDPETNELVEGLEKQTHQIFANIKAVVEEAGSDLDHVVKTTIFLKDIADYGKVNELYGTYFLTHKPARSAVAVAAIPKNALIEIEVIAIQK